MIRFNNDYNHGTHPKIIEALTKHNAESYDGYGMDDWCKKAEELIKNRIHCPDAAVHFLVGGTQTNFVAISSMLLPYQSVISADSGHINTHETGAIENTGHKVEALPATNGKLNAKQLEEYIALFDTSKYKDHITHPKMVYLSFPTELGSIYSKEELTAIRAVCNRYDLYLFIDGARLGYGLNSPDCDITIEQLAALCDAFYIGGTKCGALFGEALVLINPKLHHNFRNYIKMNGAMLAKGWILGLQFYTLFNGDLYFEITRHAIEQAMLLKSTFKRKGFYLYGDSPTNIQFIVVSTAQMETLSKKYTFEYQEKIDKDHHAIRFCTSWSTADEDVQALITDIENL